MLTLLGCLGMLAWASPASAESARTTNASPWKFTAAAAVKEAYDNNIYLQSITSLANRNSFITTFIPSVGVSYKGSEAFCASLTYAPEVNFFHSESEEDFTLHRTGVNLSGKSGSTAWDIANTFIAIDGSDLGPTFTGPGGAPAAAGPAVRDRRDAAIERGQARLTQTMGKWFVRPTVAGYLHDFQTIQKTTPGYLNFVDRNDFNGGLDAGRLLSGDTWLVTGYRYGIQNQAQLFASINPTHYDSTYHRVLFGIEGKPLSWLKLAISLGPEFRRYGGRVAVGFNDVDETYLYVDSAVTITPTKATTLVLSAKRFEQPGFGGRSTYTDSTYDLTIRYKLTDKLTVGAGARGYNTDFFKPTLRNDWVVGGSVLVSYNLTKDLNGELSYAGERGFSENVNTAGRDYTRHVVALGFKYTFF